MLRDERPARPWGSRCAHGAVVSAGWRTTRRHFLRSGRVATGCAEATRGHVCICVLCDMSMRLRMCGCEEQEVVPRLRSALRATVGYPVCTVRMRQVTC
eukprot:208306-Prymnesium_polylepis.2